MQAGGELWVEMMMEEDCWRVSAGILVLSRLSDKRSLTFDPSHIG